MFTVLLLRTVFWPLATCIYFVIPYSIGIFALWIFYTPVWGELGIAGVDATKEDHFARFRISPKYLYERVTCTSSYILRSYVVAS